MQMCLGSHLLHNSMKACLQAVPKSMFLMVSNLSEQINGNFTLNQIHCDEQN